MIIRYQNRKLYNKLTHKYIKASDVLESFKVDKNIRVVAHKTGEDVTSQVIIEALKKSVLSIDVLHNLSNNVLTS